MGRGIRYSFVNMVAAKIWGLHRIFQGGSTVGNSAKENQEHICWLAIPFRFYHLSAYVNILEAKKTNNFILKIISNDSQSDFHIQKQNQIEEENRANILQSKMNVPVLQALNVAC